MTAASSRSRRCERLAMSRWFSMMSRSVCDAEPSRCSRLAARMAISALTSGMAAFFVVLGFADVVQQQREVKQAGPVQALKQRRVIFIRRLLRLPDFVELFEADQRVFVGGVLMIKFVLHEAGQLAEFGNVFAEQVDLVHRAQNRRDFAAPFEDGQERFADVLVVQKIAVHERELVADELREVGMQLQPPLLRVQKNAHEPARRIAENAAGRGVDFAVDEFEAVHGFRFAAFRAATRAAKACLERRDERHALFQRARDEENVPHVRVKVAHEFLDALARRTVAVAERVRHGGLQVFPQHVERRGRLRNAVPSARAAENRRRLQAACARPR